MTRRLASLGLCLILLLGIALRQEDSQGASAASAAREETLVLYDAASGTIPGAPLLSFTDFPPGAALPTFSNGATVMDTTLSGTETYAGWTANDSMTPGFPSLDRTAGFRVDFTLQIERETHNKSRSGFSLILLSEDAQGLELAFWENEIWAQSDSSTGGLFQHGEGVVFPTTNGLIAYRLAIVGDTYTLSANAQPILTGPVRDYSEFEGFPDPYETPNFLFLGDDTTSAQARIRLSYLMISGAESVGPIEASSATSPSSSLPTASLTAPRSETPIPTPTPSSANPGLCPSGWLLLAIVIPSSMRFRKIRWLAAKS